MGNQCPAGDKWDEENSVQDGALSSHLVCGRHCAGLKQVETEGLLTFLL